MSDDSSGDREEGIRLLREWLPRDRPSPTTVIAPADRNRIVVYHDGPGRRWVARVGTHDGRGIETFGSTAGQALMLLQLQINVKKWAFDSVWTPQA